MDALKNKLTGSGATSSSTQQPNGQKDDYGDKLANGLDRKYNDGRIGHDNMEKITDGVRNAYEKATG